MVKFVVWGAGDRGHIAAEIFGSDRIVAFIDSDPQRPERPFITDRLLTLHIIKRIIQTMQSWFHYRWGNPLLKC